MAATARAVAKPNAAARTKEFAELTDEEVERVEGMHGEVFSTQATQAPCPAATNGSWS
jgi:hypothetical protein